MRLTNSASKLTVLGLVLQCLALFLAGCARSEQARVEAPPNYQAPPPTEMVPQLPKLPAKETEVKQALKRVFKDAVVVREPASNSFTAGDFNGDGVDDIAIVIKPAPGKIAQLNEEYPPWILSDLEAHSPPVSERPRVEEAELLLAIIHGHGINEWRDQEATQTFLLKNAVGAGLRSHRLKEFMAANTGRRLPQLQGDLLGEELRDSAGYLYYSGATYSWYDPKSFREEPKKRLVHMNARQVERR